MGVRCKGNARLGWWAFFQYVHICVYSICVYIYIYDHINMYTYTYKLCPQKKVPPRVFAHNSAAWSQRGTRIGGSEFYKPPGAP